MDKQFIIAKQVELKDDPKNQGYQIPDKQNYHYWILNSETGEVTGPLDDEGLTEKKVEFRISNNVVLKKVAVLFRLFQKVVRYGNQPKLNRSFRQSL